jgi:transcriptional regulator with XRE-family HTH domain
MHTKGGAPVLKLAADVLRELAAQRGHETDQEIAAHAGVARSTLSRNMAGRTAPGLATLHRLAKAYGSQMDSLVIDPDDTAEVAS